MKIAIIGGGPAGLYAAILLRKQRPEADIAVYERNRADDTFGFGVVFSDATLDNFEAWDPPSYRRITQEFAYWDDIAVHFRGTVHRVGGNGFCGCSRRTLLMLLQERARELGVTLHFETEISDDNDPRIAGADLVVLADGINSRFREKYTAHFEPEVDLRSNVFAWMGSTRPLDAFTFIFQETEWGPFIAHAYQYEPGHSTWIFETDPDTFERAGLKGLGERKSADRMAEIFGWFLAGHPLLINRSTWRNFPMIRSKRWVRGNMVLLGDAKATAHFSIGSGTKLAMEDAIALAEAMKRGPTVDAALEHYEHGRREEVEKTQHAADVSLVWFEHVDRFWEFDPVQFAFGVMTRSKAITYDNLNLRAPDFVSRGRQGLCAPGSRPRLRCRCRQARRADVPAAAAARDDARQPRGGVADVHVLGEGGRARRFPSGALRFARHRRRGPDLHRDGLCRPRRAHHARLRRSVE